MWRARTAFCLVAFSLVLTCLPQGCGCGGSPGGGEINLSGRAYQDAFALYYPVPAATAGHVPPYSVGADLSGLAGASASALSAEARRDLAAHGFVALRGSWERIDQAYRAITAPRFVTLDAALFAFHCLAARVLHNLELEVLADDLRGLVRAMLESMRGLFEEAEGVVREAALADLAFLGVASGLLGDEVGLPPEARELADKELALVTGAAGKAVSPLFGTSVDYAVFAPREGYGPGSGMEGYFRAFTWLGEMGFTMREGSLPDDVNKARDMARRAVLLLGVLHEAEVDGEAALAVWDRFYQTNAFLAGAVSDFNAYDLARFTREVFGSRFALRDLEDDSAVDGLLSLASAESGASFTYGPSGEGKKEEPCFRLLGVRDRREGEVYASLVADKVPSRLLPRGLDLPAAMGSERALRILEEVYGDAGMEGYGESMAELRDKLAVPASSPSHMDLFGGWLEALRVALQPRGEGYPLFMQGTAWLDRGLYSFLGSWVELGRDEAAGVENVSEGGAQGSAAGSEKGYVEPLPEAYARLAALADVMRRGLRERGLSHPESEERLEALHRLLVTLKDVSEKELRNQAPTPEEYAAIAAIGDTLSFIAALPLRVPEGQLGRGSACACAVRDLYHDPVYDEFLQAATGRPVTYYVIAPVEGRPTLTVGMGFSYYEFVRPAGQRYTRASWREAVGAGALPDPPAWTASFLR